MRTQACANDCVINPAFGREVTCKGLNPQIAVAQVDPGAAFNVA